MSESRDEMLADFQSITAIEDTATALSYLEASGWDLMTAIRRHMPQETTAVTIRDSYNQAENFDRRSSFNDLYNSSSFHRFSGPSTSSNLNVINLSDMDVDRTGSEAKTITFNIHFDRQVYTIRLPNLATIEDLKRKIQNLTKIPICRQVLRGWPPAILREAQNLNTTLESLHLSDENDLILIDMSEDGYMDSESNEVAKRFEQKFTLNIVQQPEDKTITLEFPGTQTILGVKIDVYTVTDIPVRYQDWTGWPTGSNNSTTLAQSAIELSHNLVLRSNADKAKNSAKSGKNSSNVINIDSDSSADEFEDASDFNADDDFFSDSPTQPRLKYLIPDQTDDEAIGSIQFVENYLQRYGEPHPVFFQGSLEDCLREACHKPAKERKLLAIYLHHDQSVLTNVFCDQLLRCESVMQTLIQNFILYGWDLTHESNKNLFLSSLSNCVGVAASMTVRNIPVDRLPAIIVIAKNRSACEVLSVIHGNVGVDDLLSRLMETVDIYSERIKVEIKDESERAARALVKYEQDIAYQQTLEADRAKEAAKKQKEMALAAERQRLESEKAVQAAIKETNRQEAKRLLPPEPEINETAQGVTKLKIRTPDGDFLRRRFNTTDKLQDLLNYVTSAGYPINEYKLIAGWPRRDVTNSNIDPNTTLQSLELCEAAFLEER